VIVLTKKIGILLILVAGTCLAISLTGRLDENSFLAAVIDKHARLKQLHEPKIIFIGGSNLAFSLDSEMIECRTRCPVVNMAIHAGLGLRYMIEEVRPYVNSGDIVVVVPEYEHFYGNLNGDSQVWHVLALFPEAFRYMISPGQLWTLATTLPQSLGEGWQRLMLHFAPAAIHRIIFPAWPSRCVGGDFFTRAAFNRYGDHIGHLGCPPAQVLALETNGYNRMIRSQRLADASMDTGFLDKSAFALLAEFANYVSARNARMVLTWPCLAPRLAKIYRLKIRAIQDLLQNYPEIEVWGTPKDAIVPDDDLYDTSYHLNAKGRLRRAELLLDLLHEWDHYDGEDCLLPAMNILPRGIQNLEAFEGPNPKLDLPKPARWMVESTAETAFCLSAASKSPHVLKIRAKSPIAGQGLRVSLNGKQILDAYFSIKDQWNTCVSQPFRFQLGDNILKFEASQFVPAGGSRKLYVLFDELEFENASP